MRSPAELPKLLRHGLEVVADFVYGINAGSAIRHGLPVPQQRTPRARRLDSHVDVRV
jgi:hypothetical protein